MKKKIILLIIFILNINNQYTNYSVVNAARNNPGVVPPAAPVSIRNIQIRNTLIILCVSAFFNWLSYPRLTK